MCTERRFNNICGFAQTQGMKETILLFYLEIMTEDHGIVVH